MGFVLVPNHHNFDVLIFCMHACNPVFTFGAYEIRIEHGARRLTQSLCSCFIWSCAAASCANLRFMWRGQVLHCHGYPPPHPTRLVFLFTTCWQADLHFSLFNFPMLATGYTNVHNIRKGFVLCSTMQHGTQENTQHSCDHSRTWQEYVVDYKQSVINFSSHLG